MRRLRVMVMRMPCVWTGDERFLTVAVLETGWMGRRVFMLG